MPLAENKTISVPDLGADDFLLVPSFGVFRVFRG
jgi:hypothetical protein